MNKEIADELKELCRESNKLPLLFILSFSKNNSQIEKVKKSESYLEIKDLKFTEEYQKWYSKSYLLISKLFPERLAEFESYYLPQAKRKTIDIVNYTISDSINGYTVGSYINQLSSFNKLQTQINILLSFMTLIDSRIIRLTTLLENEIFEKEINSASNLCKHGYLRAAGAICGVLLEKHLDEITKNNNLKLIKKEPSLNEYNQFLYENNVLDKTQFNFISYLASIRNKCDHNKKSDPTKTEVEDLISGTRKVVETY